MLAGDSWNLIQIGLNKNDFGWSWTVDSHPYAVYTITMLLKLIPLDYFMHEVSLSSITLKRVSRKT